MVFVLLWLVLGVVALSVGVGIFAVCVGVVASGVGVAACWGWRCCGRCWSL